MGSGTGTLFSGVVEGFILCLWSAANILYSRSTWWAVWERSCPAGFLRRTKRVFLLKNIKKVQRVFEPTHFASVRKYVGFDWRNEDTVRDSSNLSNSKGFHLTELEKGKTRSVEILYKFNPLSTLNCFTSTGTWMLGVFFARYAFSCSMSMLALISPYSPPILAGAAGIFREK